VEDGRRHSPATTSHTLCQRKCRKKARQPRVDRDLRESTSLKPLTNEETQRAEEVLKKIEALEGRDRQLWSIGLLIILVVTAGFLALVLPNLDTRMGPARIQLQYLPQLFFGFIVLILLFNIYVLDQRRALRSTRAELLRQLVRSEAAEKLSLIDPLTGVFNRRYLDQILPKEISRADRMSTTLTFVMVDLDNFKSVNNKFGHAEGDRVLREVARLMLETFRASDTIVRYGGDEFLVVMLGTTEEWVRCAISRLRKRMEEWNRSSAPPGLRVGFSCGVAGLTKGATIGDVIAIADQRMFAQKGRASV
jgi:diguanylate cyclase (GGDEF)-like protein